MSLKLYYFDCRGFGEPIRWILSHAGIEFEDIRVPLPDIFVPLPPEIKAKCRWGQAPLVEFDGKRLCQSLAITRYFANKYNLVPSDLYEAALCDEYVDSARELFMAWFAVIQESNLEKRQEKREEVYKATKPRYLDVYENIIKGNDGKHLVGNSMTWADLYLANTMTHIEIESEVSLLKDFPNINALVENVLSHPGIKAWVEKRPKTVL